jgi:hypothetical protein
MGEVGWLLAVGCWLLAIGKVRPTLGERVLQPKQSRLRGEGRLSEVSGARRAKPLLQLSLNSEAKMPARATHSAHRTLSRCETPKTIFAHTPSLGLFFSYCDLYSVLTPSPECNRLHTHSSQMCTQRIIMRSSISTRATKFSLLAYTRKFRGRFNYWQLVTLSLFAHSPLVAAQPIAAIDSTITISPWFTDKSVFDYMMYGLMITFWVAMWLIGRRAKKCSLAIMIFVALLWFAMIGDVFSIPLRKTYVKFAMATSLILTNISAFKTWVAAAFHFIVQDCIDAADVKL